MGPDRVNNTLAALGLRVRAECSSRGREMCGWRLTSAWLLTFAANSWYHRGSGVLYLDGRAASDGDAGACRVEVVPSAERPVLAASPAGPFVRVEYGRDAGSPVAGSG
jgi:hypothetical protein